MYSSRTKLNATDALKDYIAQTRGQRSRFNTRNNNRVIRKLPKSPRHHIDRIDIDSKLLLGSGVRSPQPVVNSTVKESERSNYIGKREEKIVGIDPSWDLDRFASATAVDRGLTRRLYRDTLSKGSNNLENFSVLGSDNNTSAPSSGHSEAFRRVKARTELQESLDNLRKSVVEDPKNSPTDRKTGISRMDRSLMWSALEAEIQSGLRCIHSQEKIETESNVSKSKKKARQTKSTDLARSIEKLLSSIIIDKDKDSSNRSDVLSDLSMEQRTEKVDFGSQFSPERHTGTFPSESPVVSVPVNELPLGVSVTISNKQEREENGLPRINSLLSRMDALTSILSMKKEESEVSSVDEIPVENEQMSMNDILVASQNSMSKSKPSNTTPIILAVPPGSNDKWIANARKTAAHLGAEKDFSILHLSVARGAEEKEEKSLANSFTQTAEIRRSVASGPELDEIPEKEENTTKKIEKADFGSQFSPKNPFIQPLPFIPQQRTNERTESREKVDSLLSRMDALTSALSKANKKPQEKKRKKKNESYWTTLSNQSHGSSHKNKFDMQMTESDKDWAYLQPI